MLTNFRTYQLSLQFHRQCRTVVLPTYLKDQLLRASSSIALNLAEGYGRTSTKDQMRFYHHALGSLRECQAALDLSPRTYAELIELADKLGGSLYRLCHPKPKS